MVKKILSSVIIIMMILSFTFVYATEFQEISLGETQQPEDTNKEEITTPEAGNQNNSNNTDVNGSTIKPEEDNNTNANPGDNSGNDKTNSSGLTDSAPDNNNRKEDNNQENNNVNGNNNTQQEQQILTQNNNQESSNNNYVQLKSSEARLKELKVDVEGLTPDFDKNITEYYLVVNLNINKINVTASTVDNKTKWAIYGNKNLKEGENTVTIIVTAEDGTKKEYYIHVTKVDDIELANAELESLEILGYNLYPSFKSNIYSYNLNINEDIKILDIKAVPVNENAKIDIEGNENLQEGENIIKINVTAANEETVRIYKISTYISSDRVEIQEESKLPALILIIVLGTVIIVLGVYIVLKNRR